MTRRRRLLLSSLLTLLAPAACRAPSPDVQLQIRLPDDRRLLAAVSSLELSASRDGRELTQRSFAAGARYLSLDHIGHGPRTVVALDGVTSDGTVQAHGQSCPFDYSGSGETASIYFAPTNFFGATAAPPLHERDDPLALALDDGTVLLAGGIDMVDEQPLQDAERYSPASGRFSADSGMLNQAREAAQLAPIAGVGALVVSGHDLDHNPIASSEVYRASDGSFLQFENDLLGPRSGARVVNMPDGRVLVTGGVATFGMPPLASTVLVDVQSNGSASVAPAPPMQLARYNHAAVVATGIAVVIGGFAPDGNPTATIEALVPQPDGDVGAWQTIASLQEPRADATATLLDDGTILIVGGSADAAKTPIGDAELYNPITRTTTIYPLGTARRHHTATLLSDGRVLVVGGSGADKMPIASVELFKPGTGFVSERSLATPRSEHVAVPLCDGTVLVAGGGLGAELYTPSD